MAVDQNNRNFFLLNRWAPEKGFISEDGFVWMREKVQEGVRHVQSHLPPVFSLETPRRQSQGKAERGKIFSVRGYTAENCALARNGSSRRRPLGFARVTGGLLPNSEAKIQATKAEVLEKAEEVEENAEKLAENLRVPVPKTRVPFVGPVRSLVLKQLICGIIAGGVAGVASTPFGIVKTRVLAGRGGSSTAEVVSTITNIEGAGKLKPGGYLISIASTAINKGVQFTVYEAIKREEERRHMRDPKLLPLPSTVPVATLAGAAAGFASTVVLYPMQTLSDRLMLHGSAYKSLADAFVKTIKHEGWGELYRGISPALLRMVPDAAASFYAYETFKKKYLEKKHKRELDTLASLWIGGAAGAVATTLTYPLEVARKQISFSALPTGSVGIGGAVNYSNIFEAFNGIVQREGIGGLYRGLPIQYAQIVPLTAVSFTVYEIAKRILVAEGEERRDEVK